MARATASAAGRAVPDPAVTSVVTAGRLRSVRGLERPGSYLTTSFIFWSEAPWTVQMIV